MRYWCRPRAEWRWGCTEDAGRLRRYDARQLLLTGYGAVLSYLSDGQLMTGLLDVDPLSAEALAIRREHVIHVLRTAVAP